MSLPLCRVCLSGNIRMCEISSTRYFELYEKYTGEKLVMRDSTDSICFLCNSQLRRFCAFFEMARNSEKTLTKLNENGTELLTRRNVHNLDYSAVTHTSTLDVKEETEILLKEEISVELSEETVDAEYVLPIERDTIEEESEVYPQAVTVKAEANEPQNTIYPCQDCPHQFHSTKDLNHHNITVHKHHACKKCGKTFSKQGHLKLHMNFHRGENPFVCDSRNVKISNLIASKEDKFSCVLCSKTFRQKAHLKIHIVALHTGERPFSCDLCSKKFIQKSSLSAHVKTTHKSKLTCAKCNMVFDNESELKTHIHHSETKDLFASVYNDERKLNLERRPFKCAMCSKSFGWKSHLKSHIMALHTGKRPFPCRMCAKKYTQKSHLRAHMKLAHIEEPCELRLDNDEPKDQKQLSQDNDKSQDTSYKAEGIKKRHTKIKPFPCELCSKSYGYKSHLKTHIMATHTGEKPFSCSICDMKFVQRCALNQHMRFHTGEKPFICRVCDKAYKRQVSLKKHVLSHQLSTLDSLETKTDMLFPCKICDQTFDDENGLLKHAVVHEKLSCDTCNKSFRTKSVWKRHMIIHSTDRPFSCSICNTFYKDKRYLKSHMKIHTESKQFACNQCDAKFFQKCNLTSHMRIHSGEKPFVCDSCGNCFSMKSHLRTHIIFMHTTDKRFSCNVCSKRFKLQSCLRYHQMTHTGIRPFSCNICERKFYKSSKLKTHIAKMHN